MTDFQLAYRSVSFCDPHSPLHRPISETKEIRLSHSQNTIAFEFVSLDFAEPGKNGFAYMLENFDAGWVRTGTGRKATYTNLPPGDYVFRVKGSNNDGVWNDTGTSIRIIIAPPFWKTWWAYALYLFIAVGSVIGIVKGRVRHLEKRTQRLEAAVQERTAQVVAHEKQLGLQAEKLRELDHIKSDFFANISHEFRTPLTLIFGPVQRMIAQATEEDVKRELRRMHKSAQRLLRLVNQLLDLSKLETGKMTVQVSRRNIVALIRSIAMSFASFAEQKGITLSFRSDAEELVVYFEQDKTEKIFYNLISNAFKFTPERGAVTIEVRGAERIAQSGQEVLTWPQDDAMRHAPRTLRSYATGIGIPVDRLPHVFDRFYQVDHSTTREHEGTGIGLSLVKELVSLHHGSVEDGRVEGQGSTFTVLRREK